METFNDRENKVMNFMDQVQQIKDAKAEDEAFKASTTYKLRKLDQEQDNAKEICLDKIFAKIYKDAVPLNDDYKVAYGDDLDAEFKNFMSTRCPKGMEYYVREGLKKNSPFAKRVLEAVEDLVKNEYYDKAMNIEDVKPDELVFRSDDDVQKKLDIIGQDLQAPEISQAIQDNVRATAASEIARAKKEKENLKNLERELADDVNMNSQEAIESALEMHDIGVKKDFIPTLFQGINIGKLNMIQPRYESGELQNIYLYNTLSMYGKNEVAQESEGPNMATAEELAFVESVKEYTCLSILKALKLESFSKRDVMEMAQDYAEMR